LRDGERKQKKSTKKIEAQKFPVWSPSTKEKKELVRKKLSEFQLLGPVFLGKKKKTRQGEFFCLFLKKWVFFFWGPIFGF